MDRSRINQIFWDTVYCVGITPWDTGVPPPELKVLVEKGFIKPCRALDIGCGTGTSTIYLSKNGFDVMGIDISKEAIKKAVSKASMTRAKCRFYIGDITDSNLIEKMDGGRFDVILDVGCLHTIISHKDRMRYRFNIDKLLREGGYLLLWSFTRGFPGPPGLKKEDVENLFRGGYQIVYSHRFWWQIRWGRFYILKKI